MESLLDYSAPLNVPLLDNIVNVFFGSAGSAEEKAQAKNIIDVLNNEENFWVRAPDILTKSTNVNTKFIALNTLEKAVKYRWKVIPHEQRVSVKEFVVTFIMAISRDEARMRGEKVIISKLNEILVQIAKQEWPQNWGSFVGDIVSSSASGPSICENNMNILRLMSEEIFDFSEGQMTQAKIFELKGSLHEEFKKIYELCDHIITNITIPSLIEITLRTLLRLLSWIPHTFIFQTKLYEKLYTKFLPCAGIPCSATQAINIQNAAIQCLTEIASMKFDQNTYDADFRVLYVSVVQRLAGLGGAQPLLPMDTDLQNTWDNLQEPYQNFTQNCAIFFTSFFKNHLGLVEVSGYEDALLVGHRYLTNFTRIPEIEVFKICLEYWHFLSSNLYENEQRDSFSFHQPSLFLGASSLGGRSGRLNVYAPVLSNVRCSLIERMPRPEEVIIVEDENGQIVKETLKDSDAITRYNVMRETLIYLTHLDPIDTEKIMVQKLERQVDNSEWSWNNLNTLCWAIGSISGAQSEEAEKHFLVTVIKELLGLCEIKRGKDNKAVIASNIMYIVGQYPRFLRAHWKFLKTVVNKLFEFMHERHPGVQDMACETFLKISKKCQRKFVIMHPEEHQPFVEAIIENLPRTTQDLENHQIHMFFEATGYMVQSADNQVKRNLVMGLTQFPLNLWMQIMNAAKADTNVMLVPENVKMIIHLTKTFSAVARSVGPAFVVLMESIFVDLLNTYTFYSRNISAAIATQGPIAAKVVTVKNMRAVKKEILNTAEAFIENAFDINTIYQTYVPPLLEAILVDYQTNIPDARESQVLSLVSTIIRKMKNMINPEVPRIFGAIFECTLDMIKTNLTDYPEHRTNFFNFIQSVNAYCFEAFFALPPNHLQLVINSIVWGFKHTERVICETSLSTLYQFLKSIESSPYGLPFYQVFYVPLLRDLFEILTDSSHKSVFKQQAEILSHMFTLVASNTLSGPLWNPQTPQPTGTTNVSFVQGVLLQTLHNAFPNMAQADLSSFVAGVFVTCREQSRFKDHLRDFLVQMKEYSPTDAELNEESAAAREAESRKQMIPGMLPESQRPIDYS